MAFNSNTGRQQFAATAGQTEFDFNFAIFADSDLKVYRTLAGQTASDEDDILILATNYTVSINGVIGGTVALLSGASLNDTITIVRSLPVTRETDYQTNGDLFADTLDLDQDYQTYLVQDAQARLDRSVLLPDSVPEGVSVQIPNPIPNAYFRWNATGDAIENDTTVPDAVGDVQDLVDEATAQAVIATTKAGEASTSANNALTSANNADTSEANALASANLAEKWANEDEDVIVAGGEYSAKHYALKAENVVTGIIDDITPSTTSVYSGTKTQTLHDAQAQAIANLSGASASFYSTTSQPIPETPTAFVDLTWTNNQASTNSSIFELGTNEINFKEDGNYNFFNTITYYRLSSGATGTVTYELYDADTSTVIETFTQDIDMAGGTKQTVPMNALVTISGASVADPVRLKVRMQASSMAGTIELFSFNSILAMQSSTATDNSVTLTGDQTIAGVKTFTSNPVVPTGIVFEGATADAYETTLVATDPTADRTVTIPNRSFTIAGTDDLTGSPTFSAYRDSTAQSITSSTMTKVQFQTEEWDTTSAYDNATNYRYTPQKAGYYQVSTGLTFGGTSITRVILTIRKNGSEIKRGSDLTIPATSNSIALNTSALVYLNGSTDYIEVWGYCTATSPTIQNSANSSYFQASYLLGV
jgi:hypothetical protein